MNDSIIVPAHVAKRFIERLDQSTSHWLSHVRSGKVQVGEKQLRDYQLAWLILRGDLPRKMERICDEERCCNPEHWRDATQQDFDRLHIKNAPKPSDLSSAQEEVKYHSARDYYYVLINGTQHYLGKDRSAAIRQWERHRPFVRQGLPIPKVYDGGITLGELCSRYIAAKQRDYERGALTYASVRTIFQATNRLLKFFGENCLVVTMGPDHFSRAAEEILKTRTSVGLANEIRYWRGVFSWGRTNGFLFQVPTYGDAFKIERKAERLKRENRNRKEQGKLATLKTFDRDEILRMLEVADPVVSAWIWLGINCALGQHDIALLTESEFEVTDDGVWYSDCRLKTGIPRESFVWDETFEAVNDAYKCRPDAAREEHECRIFLTNKGYLWVTPSSSTHFRKSFSQTMRAAKCEVRQRGFYALRHTFRTVAEQIGDMNAARIVMGHALTGMEEFYVHEFSRERIQKVCMHVREWLFTETVKPKRKLSRFL